MRPNVHELKTYEFVTQPPFNASDKTIMKSRIRCIKDRLKQSNGSLSNRSQNSILAKSHCKTSEELHDGEHNPSPAAGSEEATPKSNELGDKRLSVDGTAHRSVVNTPKIIYFIYKNTDVVDTKHCSVVRYEDLNLTIHIDDGVTVSVITYCMMLCKNKRNMGGHDISCSSVSSSIETTTTGSSNTTGYQWCCIYLPSSNKIPSNLEWDRISRFDSSKMPEFVLHKQSRDRRICYESMHIHKLKSVDVIALNQFIDQVCTPEQIIQLKDNVGGALYGKLNTTPTSNVDQQDTGNTIIWNSLMTMIQPLYFLQHKQWKSWFIGSHTNVLHDNIEKTQDDMVPTKHTKYMVHSNQRLLYLYKKLMILDKLSTTM